LLILGFALSGVWSIEALAIFSVATGSATPAGPYALGLWSFIAAAATIITWRDLKDAVRAVRAPDTRSPSARPGDAGVRQR
jgi:hypothetical protein